MFEAVRWLRRASTLAMLAASLVPFLADARVLRVQITQREPVLNGKSFGRAGAYERLRGRIYFSVAVANPHNRRIVDLEKAVTLQAGNVHFSADFVALRPVDSKRGNGSLLIEIPNRGGSRIVSLVEGGDWNATRSAGDGWLLRQGYSFAAIGWQWDAVGDDALRLEAPVAKDHGASIHGLLRGDLMPSHVMNEIPLGHLITGHIGGTEYPVSDPDDPRNTLTVRSTRDAERRAIPRSQWRFARTQNGKLVADNRSLQLDGGFQPGQLYEYVYAVADPVVAGLGFAAVRDFASYAKYDHAAVTPAARVYGEGISQDGRFLRDFLYQGFNANESGHMVFDGVLAHVAGAGRGSFNYRFAQPSRDAQPTSSVSFPTDLFPFSAGPETDPVSGERRGLLDAAHAAHVVPKIFLSNTSYEYWGRAAALIHTSPDGKRDLPSSENVRIYHLTGLQHFSGAFPPVAGKGDLHGQHPQSPLPVHFFWRAMIANMDAWVRGGAAPPPDNIPHIANGTLVAFAQFRFPHIPGVGVPHEANRAWHLDFGPHWQEGILSREPPQRGAPFPVLVPQVDEDGNERDGVRLPAVSIPLATYTGWNLRDSSIGAPGERVPFEGSYLPFPRTRKDREQTGDPRRSIAERYQNREEYLQRYAAAANRLVSERWILEEDREALIAWGEREWAQAAKVTDERAARDVRPDGAAAPSAAVKPSRRK